MDVLFTYKELDFVWDLNKAQGNLKKHGVGFEEAASAFYDELGFEFDDPDHSHEEDRFILIGVSAQFRTLFISHCFREGDLIRVISARKADKAEQKIYLRSQR